MAFSGTQDKCKACDNKVYAVDLVTADGIPFHKTCFKCSQCNGKLVPRSRHWSKGKGNLQASYQQCSLAPKRSAHRARKLYTQLKKVTVAGENFHKLCCRCAKGGCLLTPSNYAALDGILYCKNHFGQLFEEKGSYGYLSKSMSTKKSVDPLPDEGLSPEEVQP